jgi:hypothetical protein
MLLKTDAQTDFLNSKILERRGAPLPFQIGLKLGLFRKLG